jgi:LCP family protein required for cell wall assembly
MCSSPLDAELISTTASHLLMDSGVLGRGRRRLVPSRRNKRLLALGLLVTYAVVVVLLGALSFDFVRDTVVSSNIAPDLTITGDNGDTAYEGGMPVWTGTDRVTILLLGIDRRPEEQGPTRTDSMLLLTIDPVMKTAAVLSIPRDLWYHIPMGELSTEARINSAHYYGELYDWAGGGPALAAQTVQHNLGIRVDYHARVDFRAFEHLIDLIDGIDVFVEEDLFDPTYPDNHYGYEPLYIAAGWHHFGGEMALKYARTRHGGLDFDRVRRQQQVLRAAFEKVTQLEMLPGLVARAPDLWETLQESVAVSPDLSLKKIIALANLASEVDPADLSFYALDEDYTYFWTTPDSQQVLMPHRDRIRELVASIFTAVVAPVDEDVQAQLEAEAARVDVLNGTLVSGLATEAGETLRQRGVDVVHVGNAERSDHMESEIRVYGSATFTAEYIAGVLDLESAAVVHGDAPSSEHDIVVVLGADYAAGDS